MSENLNGAKLVDKTYVARKGFPKSTQRTTEGQLISVDEKFKVLEFNSEKNEYKLLNLDLGTPDAWFIVSQEEFDYIRRVGETK